CRPDHHEALRQRAPAFDAGLVFDAIRVGARWMRFRGDLSERHAGRALPIAAPLPEQLSERVSRSVTERLPEQLAHCIAEPIAWREPVLFAQPIRGCILGAG